MPDMPQQNAESKICGSCGDSFGCGAKFEECWCAEVKLTETAAKNLNTNFTDCLCPKCLRALEAHPGIIVKYPDGTSEMIEGAVRVDTQNFHEGMFDFYDEQGNLLRQIEMGSGISWEDSKAGV